MPSLVIEYDLDSRRPGYTFKSPVAALSDSVLKTVWRQAMPRGKGWGAPIFLGARSFKVFPVSDDMVAVSLVVVTDQIDEEGRRGIRRAEIDLVPIDYIVPFLKRLFDAYPDSVQHAARQALSVGTWARTIDNALPRLGAKQPQLVFTHPYADPRAWQIMEAVVLHLATAWPMRALPGWGRFFSSTTFALTNDDESRIVAVPADKVHEVEGVRVIPIR